jgi:hypothetical protein
VDSRETEQQQRLHDAIEEVLREDGDLKEGHVLSGWVVCYEGISIDPEEDALVGSFYGPREMTSWRALGIVEWVRRFTLRPGNDDGDDEDA